MQVIDVMTSEARLTKLRSGAVSAVPPTLTKPNQGLISSIKLRDFIMIEVTGAAPIRKIAVRQGIFGQIPRPNPNISRPKSLVNFAGSNAKS